MNGAMETHEIIIKTIMETAEPMQYLKEPIMKTVKPLGRIKKPQERTIEPLGSVILISGFIVGWIVLIKKPGTSAV